MKITKICKMCGNPTEVEMEEKDYNAWKSGELLQHAAPYLNADQREILISGICGECFDNMFADEDDD